MKTLFLICCLLSGASFGAPLAVQEPLIVHEWGTFTSLQDEGGNAIGGLNTDEEALPGFAHNVYRALIAETEGAPRCHPDVTMRLETPVIYFHPKGAWNGAVDVHVDFLGGWLTQFYPAALHPDNIGGFERITPQTTSWLTWKTLALGATGDVPKTDARVWIAPRAVDSALVATPEGERERFLFYRGVGNLDSPLRVTRGGDGMLQIRSQFGFESADPMPVHNLWLAEFRDGGKCAFRTLEPLAGQQQSVATQGSFAEGDFTAGNRALLRAAMQAGLAREGLYPDEAAAVLNTWESSYFKSGGMRLFFLVPRAWTHHFLPLQISGRSEITRVMVGRIELVSPDQRDLLLKLSRAPALRDYLKLGRFRSALVLDEEKRRPTRTLRAFILANGVTIPSLQLPQTKLP